MPGSGDGKTAIKDLRIEIISPEHEKYFESFESDNKELVDFLVQDALKNHELGISTTYLWFYNPDNRLAAYVTILMDAIRVSGYLRESFLGQGIGYKTLPVLKLAGFALTRSMRGWA